jgi:alkylation response protein AidB-like acyl-CoA dehydrogenase
MSVSRSTHVPSTAPLPTDDLDGIDLGDVLPDSPVAHVIRDDDEAIHIAGHLVPILTRAAADRDHRLPVQELALLSASGLLGITVPMEHGGADVTAETVAEVIRLLALADPTIAQISHAHIVQVDILRGTASPALRARLFPEILAGRRLSCAGDSVTVAAPDHLPTLRRRPDGTLTLSGAAHHCPGARVAHWLAVQALDGGRTVTVFVPADAPGVTIIGDGAGRAADGAVRLDAVTVDPDLMAPAA